MTNPSEKKHKQAVALRYDPARVGAPQVVASGRNEIAERIVAAAQDSGVHVFEDAGLADLLQQIPLGKQIPEELYSAVAEILAFVYHIEELQTSASRAEM